jgi:NAD(P)-dependent dehydrogenase (short-subunit alcohol dehydrogenase family)
MCNNVRYIKQKERNMTHLWRPPDLRGTVAVVAGASRGVGRGMALALGDCGATVYATGRSARGAPPIVGRDPRGEPVPRDGTIDETPEMVTARGGTGIAVRVDHTVDEEVAALFARAEREQGRLDVLVNSVWGGYEDVERCWDVPFWEQPLRRWEAMIDRGARAHFVASSLAVPLMLPRRRGLIVNTTWAVDENREDPGHVLYHLSKVAINRLARAMAHELRPHGVCALALSPAGWVWGTGALRSVREALASPGGTAALFAEQPRLRQGESPEYAGRAVASLAADPAVLARTGAVLTADAVAREHGFTDVDGRQPAFPHGPGIDD